MTEEKISVKLEIKDPKLKSQFEIALGKVGGFNVQGAASKGRSDLLIFELGDDMARQPGVRCPPARGRPYRRQPRPTTVRRLLRMPRRFDRRHQRAPDDLADWLVAVARAYATNSMVRS